MTLNLVKTKYLIIGAGPAAANAAEAIRKSDPEGKLTIITDEKIPFYSRPLITHILSGNTAHDDDNGNNNELTDKILYRDTAWIKKNRITLITACKATHIDTSKKIVRTATPAHHPAIKYDKLLIASGGEPIIPPFLKNPDGKARTFTLTTIKDAYEIKSAIKKLSDLKHKNNKSAMSGDTIKITIIGAGFIGLKAAEALILPPPHHAVTTAKGDIPHEVSVIELAPRLLPAMLDKTASNFFEEHLAKHHIKLYLGETAEGLSPDGKTLILKSGKKIAADIIISAIGVKPSLNFITDKKIKTARGIIVDRTMKTSATDVWAAGDVAESANFLLDGEKQPIPIWPLAAKQGAIAGANMSAKKSDAASFYEGGFPMNSVEVFGLPVISAGITLPSVTDNENSDDRFLILSRVSLEKKQYKKLVFDTRKKTLAGYILLGGEAIERAGIYTGLIKLARTFDDNVEENALPLLDDNFGFISVGEDTWKKSITPLEA